MRSLSPDRTLTCTARLSELRFSRHISQPGAAGTKGPRRDKCVRSRLGAPPRRAEKGDFVARG
jgi:hypothetical protein